MLWLVPQMALACPVCFGASDGPMARASNMGIGVLLGVTVVMLAALGGFFLHLRKRANSADVMSVGANAAAAESAQVRGLEC